MQGDTEIPTSDFVDEHPLGPVKPFLKWAGGKSKLIGELIPRMPKKYNRYIEPMIGGGALFFAAHPKSPILMDINPELINCYRVVQQNVEGLIESLAQHRYEREYYYKIRNADRLLEFVTWSDIARAGRTIFLNKTCFNGLHRVNQEGQFNVPFGRYNNPTILDPRALRACSKALKAAKLICAPFDRLDTEAREGDFVYFDPPYVPLNKTSSFASYSRDGFTLEDQLRLKELCVALDKRGVKFMLSNSYTDAVLELYDQFSIETVNCPRAINSKGSGRGNVKEVVVRNYK